MIFIFQQQPDMTGVKMFSILCLFTMLPLPRTEMSQYLIWIYIYLYKLWIRFFFKGLSSWDSFINILILCQQCLYYPLSCIHSYILKLKLEFRYYPRLRVISTSYAQGVEINTKCVFLSCICQSLVSNSYVPSGLIIFFAVQ